MSREDAKLALKELDILEKEELKKKSELEKLKQKIKDASKHVKEEQELEEIIPIEQVMANSVEGLSTEEKVILNMVKGSKDDKDNSNLEPSDDSKETKDSLEKKTKLISDDSLESTVAAEATGSRFTSHYGDTELAQHNYAQIVQLSQQPMTQLYDQMKNIYDTSVAEGYVSGSAVQQAVELESAIERKLADVELGNYQFSSERTAKAASVSLSMKERVSSMYVPKKDFVPGSDWYR